MFRDNSAVSFASGSLVCTIRRDGGAATGAASWAGGRGTCLGASCRVQDFSEASVAGAGAVLELPPQPVRNAKSTSPTAARMRGHYVIPNRLRMLLDDVFGTARLLSSHPDFAAPAWGASTWNLIVQVPPGHGPASGAMSTIDVGLAPTMTTSPAFEAARASWPALQLPCTLVVHIEFRRASASDLEVWGEMVKRVTTAMARRQWAKVLQLAEKGTPIEVTKNGHPVAALISIDQLRQLESMPRQTLSEVVARFRERIDQQDLEGPDPWRHLRDRSPGRDVDLG